MEYFHLVLINLLDKFLNILYEGLSRFLFELFILQV